MKNLSLILLLTVPSVSHAMFDRLEEVTLPQLSAEINTIIARMEHKQEDLSKLWQKACNMQSVAQNLRNQYYEKDNPIACALCNTINFAMGDIRTDLLYLKQDSSKIGLTTDLVYKKLCKTAGIISAIETVESVQKRK